MNLVVAIYGKESEKVVEGQRRKVIPFVGADREGKFTQMGVGFIFSDKPKEGIVWGLVAPHLLIQSWRAMKILEQVERIEDDTLCMCWNAASRYFYDSDKSFFDNCWNAASRYFYDSDKSFFDNKLPERFGGVGKLHAFRDEVFVSAPSADELITMIRNLREKGVYVDSWELEEDVMAGRIVMSPLIETLVRETQEHRKDEGEIFP